MDHTLTPIRAHYLKKTLVQLEFNREINAITNSQPTIASTFSYLGSPFAPPPKNAPHLDLPFLRYIFKQYVLTFPFMAAAPKNFYSEKLQPFLDSALSRNLSSASVLDDDMDQDTRLQLLAKMEKSFSLFLASATKLVEQEEVVRLSQRDLHRLEMLATKRQSKRARSNVFDVNIVSVRTVVDKRRMRNDKIHEEFIIRTRRSNYPDIFVSRRYGDFRTLAEELRKAHPEELVRAPPAKDKSITSIAMSPTSTTTSGSVPMSTHGSSDSRSNQGLDSHFASASVSTSSPPSQKLIRETNRLTLRAYLHTLMSSATIASSPVLRSFLTSGPTTLSPQEVEDARQREAADEAREEGRKRFAQEIASRVEGLRDAAKSVRGDIMGKDGLTQVFSTVKVTPNVNDLPPNYRAVLEWARISLAATVYHHLVAADDSSETLASLKRIHGLMPYVLLKGALKISNPIAMIRALLDLFLAQPFGGPSLLQRMFTGSLTEEVKYLQEDIQAVMNKIDDDVLCEKIRLFVYAPREMQEAFKADAEKEGLSILAVILRHGDVPLLNHTQMQRVIRAHKAYARYLKSREASDDEGPQDEDAWLFEDLRILTHLYARLRDREQLISLVFEGSTAELLKDIITIFYSPLAQVYKAASISESLGDLQNFISDLIKTVDRLEDASREDPNRTVQLFINLIQRHEQAFYTFVHNVHSKGEGLFDSLMHWIERFLTVIREGIGDAVSLESLLPHTGLERTNILREVDAVALYHYKQKVAYEEKIRRRFLRSQGQSSADAENEATQSLVQGVVEEINFGELVRGDAFDLEESDEDEDDSYSETDSSSSEEDSESDDDDDDESDECDDNGSEETLPVPKPIIRSQTIDQPPKHPKSPPPNKSPTSSGSARSGSLTLKLSRSLTNLRQRAIQNNAKGTSTPPVPPLPNTTSRNDNLRTPPSRLSADAVKSPPPPHRKHPEPDPQARSRKTQAQALKAPELEHLPQLLPIFTELMRPVLRIRQSQ